MNPGEPAQALIGSTYPSRKSLVEAGVHGVLQQGIWTQNSIALGIVMSGGYEDDEDYGDRIVYTGDGGRDPVTGVQIADQELTAGNRGLAAAMDQGFAVRVIRGSNLKSKHAPASGFRYDGLFRIEDRDFTRGKAGFHVWKFWLVKELEQEFVLQDTQATLPDGTLEPLRRLSRVERVVRSSALASAIKKLYDYRCQVCGIRLEKVTGGYAEGAHIRPVGQLHKGPDVPGNLLCLCPNHHVLFDDGAIWVDDQFNVYERNGALIGPLILKPGHEIDTEQLRYHREHRDSVKKEAT